MLDGFGWLILINFVIFCVVLSHLELTPQKCLMHETLLSQIQFMLPQPLQTCSGPTGSRTTSSMPSSAGSEAQVHLTASGLSALDPQDGALNENIWKHSNLIFWSLIYSIEIPCIPCRSHPRSNRFQLLGPQRLHRKLIRCDSQDRFVPRKIIETSLNIFESACFSSIQLDWLWLAVAPGQNSGWVTALGSRAFFCFCQPQWRSGHRVMPPRRDFKCEAVCNTWYFPSTVPTITLIIMFCLQPLWKSRWIPSPMRTSLWGAMLP